MSPELAPLAADFAVTRDALHQLAFFAVAPKRYLAAGRLGLRATGAGFGTPPFADGEQVVVEGSELAWQRGGDRTTAPITTVLDAASFLEIPYEVEWFADFHDPLRPADPSALLEVSEEASRQLGRWFEFATEALERARRTDGAEEVSEVQLWPEHFDASMEMGSQKGQRASYGGSPGDGNHGEPYLYVAAWGEIDRNDAFWNDEHFNGASLGYSELVASGDPQEAALEFLVRGYRTLTG